MWIFLSLGLSCLLLALVNPVLAEDDARSTVTVQLTDPSAPCRVRCGMPSGSITVTAGESGSVTVAAAPRDEPAASERAVPEGSLKRIPVTSSALTVEENDNAIEIDTHSPYRPVDVTIAVPVLTSLQLRTCDSGDVSVDGITGDIDVENRGGAITLKGVSGTVVAYTLQGSIIAEIIQVAAGQPMSFASLGGDLDVTLPAGVQATVRIKSPRGEVYSDFTIENAGVRQIGDPPGRDEEGTLRAHIERVFSGDINGGGPEFQFHAHDGRIFIRRGE